MQADAVQIDVFEELMPTRILQELGDGQVRFEMDVNASDRPTAFRCVNNSDFAAYGELVEGEGGPNRGRKASGVFLAHTTTEVAILAAQAQTRIQFRLDVVRNRYDWVDGQYLWPYQVG